MEQRTIERRTKKTVWNTAKSCSVKRQCCRLALKKNEPCFRPLPCCPVDLSPMPQLRTPCKGSSTSSNNSSTGKRCSVIDKHSSKTPSKTWPTSSNACTIGL
ncbi:hypothetical protein Salat_1555000 [Sesamum alatum]|uniref:Uncharacterized protein n=1 Tax=Sesamum alatum TaxID=300844 RepID=A0AAE1YCZ8_9LAMI|nr:hypothetical protein Salat_1555000 [Sesamum alatum]